MKKRAKDNIGITLIALIITVIILIILAGISIANLTGNGLFEKAKLAKEKSQNSEKIENSTLFNYETEINKYINGSSRVDGCDHLSNDIKNFSPIIDEINGTYITASVPEDIAQNSINISGYAFLIDGKVKKYTTDSKCTFDNLEFNTSHNIMIIAMDEKGKIKYSSEISETTLNKLYLYNEGNECTPITGGWKETGWDGAGGGTFEKKADNLYIYAPWAHRVLAGVSKQINITDYSKMYIEANGGAYICNISKTAYYNGYNGNDIVYKSMEPINISSYNEEYYIHITIANENYTNVKRIWLEK